MMGLTDTLGRPLRDLRISVTDRCNFRCPYCMPKELFGADHAFLPSDALLQFDEIERVARLAAAEGVRKLRLTGGEPLLRPGLSDLVQRLARIAGIEDIALTTNGVLLPRCAERLRAAGLHRVTVSLDSLDEDVFASISGVNASVHDVLAGIEAAERAGLGVKINTVVRRGHNEQSVLPLARRFHGTPHVVRFIEFMDVGTSNGWSLEEVVSARSIVDRIHAALPLVAAEPRQAGEVARRYRHADGGGEIGVIASVTEPFCRTCTRLRLSAEGKLYTCLFAEEGADLRALLRRGADDAAVRDFLRGLWGRRADRYSEQRGTETALTLRRRKVEMSYIGG